MSTREVFQEFLYYEPFCDGSDNIADKSNKNSKNLDILKNGQIFICLSTYEQLPFSK